MIRNTLLRVLWIATLFLTAAGPHDAEALPPYPAMTNAVFDDMANTYFYCFGQRETGRMLGEKFPTLRPEIQRAQAQFDLAFGPALTTIDRILTKESTVWVRGKTSQEAQLSSQMSVEQSTYQMARDGIAEIERRTSGKIPSPFLETLLIYHPDFLRNPAEEFSRGYTQTIDSEDYPKLSGLRFKIEFPKSWKVRPGKHQTVAWLAGNESGRGFVMSTATIEEVPIGKVWDGLTDDEKLAYLEQIPIHPDGTLRSTTRTRVEALPVLLREYDLTSERMGMTFAMRVMDLVLIRDGKTLIFQFTAERGEDYTRHLPLFWMISNSLVIDKR